MATLDRHTSPDGQLTFRVDYAEGDWTVGFEQSPAHTHGDLIQLEYSGPPEAAVNAFVNDILGSIRPLIIWRVDGAIRMIDWPTEIDHRQLEADLSRYGHPGETYEVRFWDGRPGL